MGVKKVLVNLNEQKLGAVLAELIEKGYTKLEVITPSSEKHKRYGLAEGVLLIKAWGLKTIR